jgi:hypothetical protein
MPRRISEYQPLPDSTVRDYQQRYDKIRTVLRTRCPESWTDVVNLCNAMPQFPKAIQREEIWIAGRATPCFSRTRVAIGSRCAREFLASPDADSYKTIAGEGWAISFKLNTPPARWQANANFFVSGQRAREHLDKLSAGGLKSFLWRLYAIRLLACALASEAKEMKGTVDSLISELNTSFDPVIWPERFSRALGRGWGPTSASHLAANLGKTIVPTRHVVCGAEAAGFVEPGAPSEILVRTLTQISHGLRPLAAPDNPNSTLREIDKTLMEWTKNEFPRS